MQEVPKDLGRRILEMAALAADLHMEQNGAFDGVEAARGGTVSRAGGTGPWKFMDDEEPGDEREAA